MMKERRQKRDEEERKEGKNERDREGQGNGWKIGKKAGEKRQKGKK